MSVFPKYERYKDSGVEWLGVIPEHWNKLRAKHVFRNVSEKGFPDEPLLSATQDQGVVPRDQREQRVVMPIGQLESFKLVRENDFVISLRSFQGGIEHCAYRGLVSPAYTVLRLHREVNPRFLRQLLKASNFISEINVSVTGIRQGKNIDYGDFAESFLPIPPKPEQDSIVAFLDQKTAEIDALIAKKQRQIELLDEQKAILINRAVTRGLNRNAKLKPSGIEWIGDIPEHWEVKKVKHLASLITKGTTPSSEGRGFAGEGIRFLKSENIVDGSITLEPRFFIDHKTHGVLGRSQLSENDVLFVIAGAMIGKTALVDKSVVPANTNQAVCLIRPNAICEPRYLLLWLTSNYVSNYLKVEAVQSAQPNISMEDLGNIEILIPPAAEILQICLHCDSVKAQAETVKDAANTQIKALKTLRSTLIAHAVTGRIKV
jgi:type I restriction enzyme S subunit